MVKNKGWVGESQRHRMASKGIKSANKKVKRDSRIAPNIHHEFVRLIENDIFVLNKYYNDYNQARKTDSASDTDYVKIKKLSEELKLRYNRLNDDDKEFMFQSLEPQEARGAIEMDVFTYDEAYEYARKSGNVSNW
jgi:hypothetical protein